MTTPIYNPASLKNTSPIDSRGVVRTSWASVTELVADAFDDYGANDNTRERLRAHYTKNHVADKYANGHTVATLKASIHNPKQEIVEAVDEMRAAIVDEIKLPVQAKRKVRRGQEWGEELDSDRFLSHEPNAWDRNTREQVERRTVTIGVNMTVFWSQKPSELLYRGAAAVALADLLTQRGVNVRVVGFVVAWAPTSTVTQSISMIEIKSADMPMDVATLAAAVCDVGFTRMVIFPAEYRHMGGRMDDGMGGRDRQLPYDDRAGIDFVIDNGVTTKYAAVELVKQFMAQQPA